MARTVPVTYYDLLGVEQGATFEQIKAAYKVKRRDAHPDHGGSAELWRFFEQIFQTLSDPAARAEYDRSLRDDDMPPQRSSRSSTPPRPHDQPGTDRPREHAGSGQPRPQWSAPLEWEHPAGPVQTFYPPLGVPVGDGDPRLRKVVRRRGAGVVMGVWWTVGALLAVAYVAVLVGVYLRHASPGVDPVGNLLFVLGLTLGPQSAILTARRAKQRDVRRWNTAVRAGDAALNRDMDRERSERKEWGQPGTVSQGRFGDRAVLGNHAEQRTAAALRRWMAYVPAARIMHGLRWPGTPDADIDHVVVVGNRVAVIDTKAWGSGHFYWDGRTLFREGKPMPTLRVADATAALAGALRAAVPQVPLELRSWVLLQAESAVRVECRAAIPSPVVSEREIRDQLAEWLVRRNPNAAVVDRRLIKALSAWLK